MMAAIDTSIYRPLIADRKSVADYDAIEQGRQMNALALQGRRMNMLAAQREMQAQDAARAEGQTIRNALMGVKDEAGAVQALRATGLPSAYKMADEILKAATARGKDQADIGYKKAQTGTEQGKAVDAALKRYRSALDMVDSPEVAAQWLAAQYQDPETAPFMQRMGPLDQAVQRIPTDPQGFQTWRQRSAMGMDNFIKAQETERNNRAQVQTTQRGQDISAATQRRGQDITASTTIRGQNLTDARTRERFDWERSGGADASQDPTQAALIRRLGKPAPGYWWKPDGSGQEAIPGGPADIKAGEIGAKTEQRRQGAIQSANAVLDTVEDAKGLVGISTTGVGSWTAKLPATPARNLAAKLETIKANLGFDRLQQMREASPTGGALGAVAVQELTALQSTVASLDQAQSPGELKAALEKIETHYGNWLKAMGAQRAKKSGERTFKVLGPE